MGGQTGRTGQTSQTSQQREPRQTQLVAWDCVPGERRVRPLRGHHPHPPAPCSRQREKGRRAWGEVRQVRQVRQVATRRQTVGFSSRLPPLGSGWLRMTPPSLHGTAVPCALRVAVARSPPSSPGALNGRSDRSDRSDKSVVRTSSSLRTADFPSQFSSRVQMQIKSGHLFEAAACVHQVITGANYFLRRRASATAAPISAGEGATTMPAASSAATFSAAVPLPPVMIAPA